MKSLLIFATLFFALAFAENYTSSWATDFGSLNLWNAEGSTRVWGSFGFFTFLKGRVRTNDEGEKYISGKFHGPGKRFGGVQLSQRNFRRLKGTFSIWFTDEGATLTYNYKGAGGPESVELKQILTVCNEENYVFFCGVRPEKSDSLDLSLDGHWQGVSLNYSVCTESDEASYALFDRRQDFDVSYGYQTGECTSDGTICMFDYYRKTMDEDKELWLFGAHLYVLLAGGTNAIFSAIIGVGNDPLVLDFTYSAELLNRPEESFELECNQAASSLFNPTKCHLFDNDVCETGEFLGLCQLNSNRTNQNGSNCFKVPFVESPNPKSGHSPRTGSPFEASCESCH